MYKRISKLCYAFILALFVFMIRTDVNAEEIKEISLGVEASCDVTHNSDEWFKFEMKEDGFIQISLRLFEGSFTSRGYRAGDITVSLYKGSELVDNWRRMNQSEIVTGIMPCEKGAYYLNVKCSNSNYLFYPSNLKVDLLDKDDLKNKNLEIETNNTFDKATKIEKGLVYDGHIHGGDDDDYYKIELKTTTNSAIVLDFVDCGRLGDGVNIEVYNSNKICIYSKKEVMDSFTSESFKAKPGEYYVHIERDSNLEKLGYTLSWIDNTDYGLTAEGIYTMSNDENGFVVGMVHNIQVQTDLEFRWTAYRTEDQTSVVVQDWKEKDYWLKWKPEQYGEYILTAEARVKDAPNVVVSTQSEAMRYTPFIKGKCQMPYYGEGGGYLIGIETYDNPNQSYTYEMLILDCTLLAEGKDAWIYTTGRCGVAEGNALWTVWQPQYGYYWTLFRVYNANGEMIDQDCYGFVNAY